MQLRGIIRNSYRLSLSPLILASLEGIVSIYPMWWMKTLIGRGSKVLKGSKTVLEQDRHSLLLLIILKIQQFKTIRDKKQKGIEILLIHGYTIFMTVGHQ